MPNWVLRQLAWEGSLFVGHYRSAREAEVSDIGPRLVELWRDFGVTIRPPARPETIHAFESRYGVTLPDDLRAYFLTVDGIEGELDSGTNRFWPLEMVKPVEEELSERHGDRTAYPGCFFFADHCIWCFAWAVRLDRESAAVSGPVFLVTASDTPGHQIAPSFAAFVEMYLLDPDSVR